LSVVRVRSAATIFRALLLLRRRLARLRRRSRTRRLLASLLDRPLLHGTLCAELLAGLLNRARLELLRLLDRPWLFDRPRLGAGLELPRWLDRPLLFNRPRLGRLLDGPRLLDGACLELLRLLDCPLLLNRPRLGGLLDRSRLLDGPRLRCWPHLLRLPPALLGVLHPVLIVLAHLVLLRAIVSERCTRPAVDIR
jgi:hypothetical protein